MGQTPCKRALIPYDIKRPPRDLSLYADDVAKLLSRYKTTAKHSISIATILKSKSSIFDPLSEQERENAFTIAEIIKFCGLSGRRLFSFSGYVNSDNFALVSQDFVDPSAEPSTASRRRDGKTFTAYSPGMFEERCPPHVNPGHSVKIDNDLAKSLVALFEQNDEMWSEWNLAIRAFNSANTDSERVRPSGEMILLCGAIERILGSRTGKESEFVRKLKSLIKKYDSPPASFPTKNWKSRYQSSSIVTEAWALDFFRLRSKLAHGRGVDGPPIPIWTADEHLLLRSFISPLLLKLRLADADLYQIDYRDTANLRAFCAHLNLHDSFGSSDEESPDSFYWDDILRKFERSEHIAKITAELTKQTEE